MVEAGTIGALSKVMEVGAMDSVLSLVAAALRCLTQAALPSEAHRKEGTAAPGNGEDVGGKNRREGRIAPRRFNVRVVGVKS